MDAGKPTAGSGPGEKILGPTVRADCQEEEEGNKVYGSESKMAAGRKCRQYDESLPTEKIKSTCKIVGPWALS